MGPSDGDDIIATYRLNDDGELRCTHANYIIEAPCCSGNDCDCRGLSTVICRNPHCTGMTELEINVILEGADDD